MKANTGLNLHGFYSILKNIADLRISSLMKRFNNFENLKTLSDYSSIFNKCRSALVNLKSITGTAKLKSVCAIMIPYEICDICFLVPVLLIMCEYYNNKQLINQLEFFDILCKCYTCINLFCLHVSEML